MSNAAGILSRCRQLGLEVWADGDRIGIAPKENIPPGLLDEIRAAKPDLLPLVREGEALRLTPDQIPWLHVARQVLAGEFAGADRSLRESLVIGLRSIPHPLARRAFERLGAKSSLP
jgi:hypothetical protein